MNQEQFVALRAARRAVDEARTAFMVKKPMGEFDDAELRAHKMSVILEGMRDRLDRMLDGKLR